MAALRSTDVSRVGGPAPCSGSRGETSARCRVEHVDVSGVGGDVESFALAGRLAALHTDDDVVRGALDTAGPVHVGVCAELLDDLGL